MTVKKSFLYILLHTVDIKIKSNELVINNDITITTSPTLFYVRPNISKIYLNKQDFKICKLNDYMDVLYIINPRTGKYKKIESWVNDGG